MPTRTRKTVGRITPAATYSAPAVAAEQPYAYLAGVDVFRPDGPTAVEAARAALEFPGLKIISPLDAEPPRHLVTESYGAELAQWFKRTNVELIRGARIVIAQMTPWRGPHMDCGTAFEVGYAEALGIPVLLFGESRPLKARIECRLTSRGLVDASGNFVEDFGLSDNLMITSREHELRPVYSTLADLRRALERLIGVPAQEGADI